MTRIYLDMDGVIANFDKGIERAGFSNRADFIHKPYSEWTDDDKKVNDEVRSVMNKDGFFMNLPMMHGAYKLWNLCSENDHYVLTAYPFGYKDKQIERVKNEKWIWLTDTFGSFRADRFICCDRYEKASHSKYGRVLIDDSAANCSEWEAKGGTAIRFETMSQTLKELKKIVG